MISDVRVRDLAGLAVRWRVSLDALGAGSARIAVDAASAVAVVAAGWEPVPRVVVIDLTRGRVVDVVEPVATIGIFGVASGIVCHDAGWRPGPREPPRLLALSAGGRIADPLEESASLIDVAPDGRELVVFNEGVLSVRRWPDGQETHRFHGYSPAVDWATRTLVFRATATHVLEAWSFGERIAAQRSIPVAEDGAVIAIGRGLLVPRGGGLTLVSIAHGWRRPILPSRRKEHACFSLDESGTRVRFLLGGKPRVVRFDPATGEVVEAPSEPERLLRKSEGLFHPALDVAVYSKSRARPSVDLRLAAPRQPIVGRLGTGTEPVHWTPDGRTLLAIRGDGKCRELEAWSVS